MEREMGTIDERGRLVVPRAWRETLGLLPGEQAVLMTDGAEIRVVNARREREAIAKRLRGSVKGGGTVDDFIAARRIEAQRESSDS